MLSQKIKAKAKELGYLRCGIIPASTFDEYLHEIDERSGRFPESKKYYDKFRHFGYPPENAKSIIVCTQRYNKYKVSKDFERYYGKQPFQVD